MKKSLIYLFILCVISLVSCDLFNNKSGVPINEDVWVNGYLVSWEHNPETVRINSGKLSTNDINWDALTHLTYFSLNIDSAGRPALSFDPDFRYNINTDRLNAIVPAAHANNTKIIISVGGAGNYEGFSSAIEPANRAEFMNTINMMIRDYDFDGVSLNMTPIEPSDYQNYTEFVRDVALNFDTVRTYNGEKPLITVAALKTAGITQVYAEVQEYFDQINFLVYDMAQPWRGWQAWHNTPLYNDGVFLENSGNVPFPSIETKVDEALRDGIDRSRLGIAANLYGSVWQGVHLLEKWPSWPTQDLSIFDTVPYSELYENYDLDNYQWDSGSHAAYVDLDDPKVFISFDNERSVVDKLNYAKKNRLGGIILWEISASYTTSDNSDHLLKAIQQNLIKK